MAEHQGIRAEIEGGSLALSRADGFGTGHVSFMLRRLHPGYSQDVVEGTVVLGSQPSYFDLPMHSAGDNYEISLDVDMRGPVTMAL